MNKIKRYVIYFIAVFLLYAPDAQSISENLKYLAQPPPGLIPEKFAPGIVSLDNRLEFNTSFSSAGDEFYFTIGNTNWTNYTIMRMGLVDSQWSNPDTAEFCSVGYDDLEPFITYNNQYLYFTSGRPPSAIWDLWRVKRSENGWSEPEILADPINTVGYENYPFIVQSGTLYFVSSRPGTDYHMDIYRSELVDSQYLTVENLGDSVNSEYDEFDPFVATDESYIIFSSNRPGGYGRTDLYISYRKIDKSWTKARNLGSTFNTDMGEGAGPKLTDDGKYFFFSRYGNNNCDIYWVDARALDSFLSSRIESAPDKNSLENFYLDQNHPYLFNNTTMISYQLPEACEVKLSIYNLLGQEIAALVNGHQSAGQYQIKWNAEDQASGLYFYWLQGSNFTETKKLILIK
jgi:hypothetical protein